MAHMVQHLLIGDVASFLIVTVLLLAWLFIRFAGQDEERQRLADLALDSGVELSDERAQRAAAAGPTGRLRERIARDGSSAPR
jgi:hypothetical protein